MKNFYLLLGCLFLLITDCLPQDASGIISISNIPAEGILLDKGWRFQAGDNPAWAKPGYDDRKWHSINPALDIHKIPILWKHSIFWFRLDFKTDSVLIGQLAMMIQQAGASEIYLNGKLIERLGIVGRNREEIIAVNPREKPASLPVVDTSEQVLAVRYVLQPGITYSTNWGYSNYCFLLRIGTFENANHLYFQTRIYSDKSLVFRIGVYLLLGVLYLAFYLSYPTHKINLQFSLYAFISAIHWSITFYLGSVQEVQPWFYLSNLVLILGVVSFFLLLSASYQLLEQKKGFVLYTLYVIGLVSIPFGAFVYGWGWLIYVLIFANLVNIDITRIAFKAVKQHKKGAWIIAAGGIACLFSMVAVTASDSFGWVPIFKLDDALTLLAISIPVTVSIYLGYDFALTHRSLQQKFAEVKMLSEEKNQILSAQNEVLEKQVSERTAALNQSLNDLKSTQAQLIHQEKMASLGELTAGIAHEIQNPLNFVNNFSEVNKELAEELKGELLADNKEEAISIAYIIIDNEEKIIHHGKRADAIVKGMLQHSKASTGVKESTDINKLADEYLRLSYHGMRAKDKSFEVKMETAFDASIGKINVVSQDIGRVLLNLFNNAFYAVNEKNRSANGSCQPTVSVVTKKLNDKIEVIVKDNGTGIPKGMVDKIFQPFFTTKPTGLGTGLGLSLAYDIIKAHGGEIKVETKEGEGSEFIVRLPV